MVYKRQLKFFRKFKESCLSDVTAPTSKIFLHAMDKNIFFLRHYKQLDMKFNNPKECFDFYREESGKKIFEKIIEKHLLDINSALGTYYRINPLLKSPELYSKPVCSESKRTVITQFRTGSHYLRIQTGRMREESRDSRLCKCNIELQTVEHLLFKCPNTANIRAIYDYETLNLTSFFESKDYVKMADILKSINELK